jgi:cytoskeletal protein CcmA (bactofilin family)
MHGRNGSINAEHGKGGSAASLLTIVGESARIEGKFEIADSIEIECEIGGQLSVGRKLVISEKGVVKANVHTVDAVIHGTYEGTMVATGEVEITSTGRVSGRIETDALVIAKGGTFTGDVIRPEGGKNKAVYVLDEKRVSSAAIPVEVGR